MKSFESTTPTNAKRSKYTLNELESPRFNSFNKTLFISNKTSTPIRKDTLLTSQRNKHS
jgi:hypothetical protein